MIITRLTGGLGNQLFQYAAGRRLANARGVVLKLDISGISRGIRKYELAHFNMKPIFATEQEVADLARPRMPNWSHLLPRRFRRPGLPPATYVKEQHFNFDPAILDLPNDVYMEGYWQSERYFADAAELIRKEVVLLKAPRGQNEQLAREIASCQAISLHVRRGDYVSNEIIQRIHGVCSLDYYERAVAFITSRVNNPTFFIFSDDPDWVREHFKLPYLTQIVGHNGPELGYEDMRLMSLCNHHIIANSSFSWWGAWLNPGKDKIVVAPKRWFNTYDADTSDLCPDSWVRI
jgi:hypothetical protein